MLEFVTVVGKSATVPAAQLGSLRNHVLPESHFTAADSELRCSVDGRRVVSLRSSTDATSFRADAPRVLFEGIAVARGRLVTGPAVEALLDLRTPEDLARETENWRGAFVIVAEWPDGRFTVTGDPLGTYPIFYAETARYFGVSNNALLLERALRDLGDPPRRSSDFFGVEVMFGSGALGMTPYEEIRLMPLQGVFEVSPEQEAHLRRHGHPTNLYRSHSPVRALIDQAAEEIGENVRVLARGPFEAKMADLTGGVDSRIVLAAILAEGFEGEFAFFCGGGDAAPDYRASAYLQDVLGLREARGWLTGQSVAIAEDPIEAMRVLLHRTMGCYSQPSGTGSGSSPAAVADRHTLLRLHGGMAGTFKGVLSAGRSYSGTEDAVTGLLGRRGRMLSARLRARVAEEVRAYFESKSTDFSASEAVDQWYIENRNRYHFGLQWRIERREREAFNPLYTLAATRAAYSLPTAARARHQVGFELLGRLYEPLRLLPFAGYRWPSELTEPTADRMLYRGMRPFTPDSPAVHVSPGRKPTLLPYASDTIPRAQPLGANRESAWTREQRRLGRPSWWFHFDRMLPAAREYVLGGHGEEALWDTFDEGTVRDLLVSPLERDWKSQEVRLIQKVLAAAIWMSNDEMAPPRATGTA